MNKTEIEYRYRVMSMNDRATAEVVGWSVFRKPKGRGHKWQGVTFGRDSIFSKEEACRRMKELESRQG